MNEALKSALESIEDAPYSVYLEYKDDKSHKFWRINYYDSFRLTKGKIGTDGKTKNKRFKNNEEAKKEAAKLITKKKAINKSSE